MTTKTIQTRIKNRFDTLTEWNKGAKLLQGEIALVSVTTVDHDPATGEPVYVPAVLMKVGANYTEAEAIEKGNADLKDTPKPFGELPWLSAKAADVYDWAKAQDPSSITIKYNNGTVEKSSTLADILKDLEAAEADIAALNSAIAGGTHFIGKTNEQPYVKESVTYVKLEKVVDGTPSYQETKANAGDIVLYVGTDATHGNFEKEFISTGSEWQELGDLGRVGNLETLIGSLATEARTNNEYVTFIKNEDGKLEVQTARPTGDEVLYEERTDENDLTKIVPVSVNDKFGEVDATIAAITENYIKINGNNLVNQDNEIIIFDCGGAADF